MRVLRLARSGSAVAAVVGQERALGAAAPQRVGDPPGDLGGAGQQLGQLTVVRRRPAVVVQHPRPDPVGQQRAQLLARRGQGVEEVRVALLDERSGPP